MGVSLKELEKAVTSLEKALKENKNDIVRDAVIQRFEFCVELAWKVSKKIMGTSSTAPKQVIREMAQNSLIKDPSPWLEAIDKRNLSSHTYNENLAEEVFSFANSFLPLLKDLFKVLKSK